jgi:DNA-binding transcriptional MerR regulator
LFSIGEFSRISGLSVKTLRFYHERGLLAPACVDGESGYRYYGQAQLERARVIVRLRELEFALDEIATILAGHEDEGEILDLLANQQRLLEERSRRCRDLAAALANIIRREKEARDSMSTTTFEVVEKDLDKVLIAGVRMKGKYSECGQGFAKIGRAFGRYIAGKCFLLHYDCEYHEEADFEACFPISRAKQVDGISVRDLPGGRCVALLHQGPYEELGRSYAKVLAYAKHKGYEVVLPTREVYIKGPGMIFRGNPKNYLTEIQMLIQ